VSVDFIFRGPLHLETISVDKAYLYPEGPPDSAADGRLSWALLHCWLGRCSTAGLAVKGNMVWSYFTDHLTHHMHQFQLLCRQGNTTPLFGSDSVSFSVYAASVLLRLANPCPAPPYPRNPAKIMVH
jgi:hypothetical protein